MDVFNYHHYHRLHQQPQQQYYNMPYYYPNEVLYPDYNAYPQPNDFNSPFQVYNFEKPIDNTDYFLYAPDSQQYPDLEDSNVEIEEILRTNEEVWEAYQTGKFRTNVVNEDGHKKIILKEKTRNEYDESEYVIRRFKVTVTTPRNSRVKDDHVLLVSFSQKSFQNNTSLPSNQIPAVEAAKRLEIEPSLQRDTQNLMPFQRTTSQILTGPGSELINKIINGEEDSFLDENQGVYEDEGEYEPAYEIQLSPSKTSSDKMGKKYYTKNSSHTDSSSSESENYINDIIDKIKNSSEESPRHSRSNVSRSQFSSTPFSQTAPINHGIPGATPVSVSYIGGSRYNEQVKAQMDFGADESIGNVSRSSTRNASVHEHVDTHSIGPGSMAGGSLFGGYIPNHVESNIEKSAFSEYNLTKNEDGDYVLRDATGKSEIFDGKSGLSKSQASRSQVSRGDESRSNMSKFEDKSSRSSRVKF